MTSSLEMVAGNVAQTITQLITGKLLTDAQIRAVTKNAVGRYFAEWFAKPKDEQAFENRVTEARDHLVAATGIIFELKESLEDHTRQLDQVAEEVKVKKAEAERYSALASVSGQSIVAIKEELQESLRRELEAQSKKGRRLRQVVAFVIWLITLVLGSYLPAIINWSRARVLPPAQTQNVGEPTLHKGPQTETTSSQSK